MESLDKPDAIDETPAEKRPYESPQLIELGNVAEYTNSFQQSPVS